ncbi:hypothetical protein QP976_12480, partial [Corynebacterium striatum]|uniref:hypothetical protein n=1 Tax=Corynebacterium striatum TaxID=43770 RepID=UPI00254D9A65
CPVGLGVVVIFLCIVIFGFASLIKNRCCCFFDGVGFWLVCFLLGLGFSRPDFLAFVLKFFVESLILAQDERWRRA